MNTITHCRNEIDEQFVEGCTPEFFEKSRKFSSTSRANTRDCSFTVTSDIHLEVELVPFTVSAILDSGSHAAISQNCPRIRLFAPHLHALSRSFAEGSLDIFAIRLACVLSSTT